MKVGGKNDGDGDGRRARVPALTGAGGPPTPWDRIWSYARYSEPSRRRARARQKIDLLTAVGLRVGPQDTVLDLGCGSGEVTLELARRGARPERWLACDSSVAACSRAVAAFEREGLEVDVVCADARRLPHRHGAASIVIACGVLEHVPEVDDAVSEIARILRRGGRLMLTT
jgi:ubiquinone/menaquinone biosynthesis C-methylase UbiE